ncbi:MAG: nuclear transport factor 2 family protein [Actinomycetota bacterium]|nr:nuclear transport factor 2 family protein [Actinomycetota bacterium]
MTDIEVVQAVYAAMAERDVERLLQLVDPSIVVTQDPALPWGGRHVGHDGLGAFVLALTGAIDSAVTTEAIFAADDEVIQFGRTRGTARGSGDTFDVPEVHRWAICDGKAVAAHFSIDTEAMLDALSPTRR